MTTVIEVCEHAGVVYAFDEFELDPEAYELRQGGEPISLEPQVFEVLVHLVRHADRVVTKNELLDEVWGSRFVSESALTTRIKTARQALGDDGRAQRFIRTVHGRGYRFVGEPVLGGVGPAGTAGEVADTPAVGAPSPVRDNLPIERTPLFGRDADIVAVGAALDGHRLVSLLGIGGTGKTRLAIAAARATADRFPDGVWFVDLVPVSDADGIELALAETAGLGLGAGGTARDQIASLLRHRRVLIVIDNAEHVSDDAAAVIDHLLAHTTEPRVLATSRVPLGLLDERRMTIHPLPVDSNDDMTDVEPDTDARTPPTSPAVSLLRAAAERFGAPLDGVDPEVMHRICRSLDGLPLAIELAAAQLRHLDATAVADRLDRRFDVLADRAHPERHASLQGVLADTWDALEPGERTLLEQLAAFPATFTLDDLCSVAEMDVDSLLEDVELGLGGLVDRSLVVREAGRRSRYRLLETVKLFARQQCDDDRARQIADTHAAWCLASVGTDPRRHVFDFDLAEWCAVHHDDLRAAGRHLRATDRTDDAARLLAATALTMHLDAGARASITLDLIERDLAAVDDDALAAGLHATAVMCGMATRSPTTIADHGERGVVAARRAGDPVLVSVALVLASWSTIFADPELALAQTAEASDIAAAAGEESSRDFGDAYGAIHLAILRRYDEAEATARAVVDRAPVDEPVGYPTYVGIQGLTVLQCVDEADAALVWVEEMLGPRTERSSMWADDLVRGCVHASAGDAATAWAISSMILRRLDQAGQEPWPDLILTAVAHAVAIGEEERAAGWLDAIRSAGRPTQSFQATVLYRRFREAVSSVAGAELEGDIESIGRAALTWLEHRA